MTPTASTTKSARPLVPSERRGRADTSKPNSRWPFPGRGLRRHSGLVRKTVCDREDKGRYSQHPTKDASGANRAGEKVVPQTARKTR
jgi:hypothetical protein